MKSGLRNTFENLKRLDDKINTLKGRDFVEVDSRILVLEDKREDLITQFAFENEMSVDNYISKYNHFIG